MVFDDGHLRITGTASPGATATANHAAESPVEQRYIHLKQRFERLAEELKSLTILDKKLRQQILAVRHEMQVVVEEYNKVLGSRRKLLAGQASQAEEQNIHQTASSIEGKLTHLEESMNAIDTELRRGIGASLAGNEAKTRPKTDRERLLEEIRADNRAAKSYNYKNIDELEQSFEELRQRRQGLKFAGSAMVVISVFAFQLEGTIPKQIEKYRNLGTEDSKILIPNTPGALKNVAQRELNTLAANLYYYEQRLEWLEKLEKELHQIIRRASEAAGFGFDFSSLAQPDPQLASKLAETIEKRMTETTSRLIDKSIAADAFINVLLLNLRNEHAPKSIEDLINLLVSQLLRAVMKKDVGKNLLKEDVKQLRTFFHPDRFSAQIDNAGYEPEMKESLKSAISSIFRVSDETYQSALFEMVAE